MSDGGHIGNPVKALDDPAERAPLLAALPATGEAIDARGRLIAAALREVGLQDPNIYYRIAAPQFADKGQEHSTSWCGIFCLAMLLETGLVPPDWRWVTEEGFVNRTDAAGRRWFPKSQLPLVPGDIVVFSRNWHHAIVRDWSGGKVRTIDGNTLPFPQEGVAERERPIVDAYGFYSLARLLGESP